MIGALHAFHFLQPWWLLGLLGLPLAWWLVARRGAASAALSRLVDATLLPHLLRGTQARHPLAPWAFSGAWALVVLALAGPTWNRLPQPLYADRAAQIVALSLSSHMRAQDVVPSRLERARFKVRELLATNRDGLNALLAYAGEAFVVAPLTGDATSLDDLLAALAPDTMPVDGNDAAAAIERAVALAHDAGAGAASLVLVTDQADAAAVRAARAARAAGLRVSVLGVGTAHGGPVTQADGELAHDAAGHIALAPRDDTGLAELAAAGGGRYVAMSGDRSDIDAMHAQLRLSTASVQTGHVGAAWQDRGPWLLLPLLLLAPLAFRRGWLYLLALAVLPGLPGTVHAGSWTDLWQRRDQQAATALRRGDAKTAQAVARDPGWRGVAAYRAGDYPTAARVLQGATDATAAYNRGNALARAEQFDAAIAAYDRALQLQPDMPDARANRQAVVDWLKQKRSDAGHKMPNQAGSGQAKNQPGTQGQPGQAGQQASPPAESNDAAGAGNGASGPHADKPAAGDEQGDPATGARSAPGTGTAADREAQDAPPTASQQAAQRAQAAQAEQALGEQMDKALQAPAGKAAPAVHDLGATDAGDAQSKLPADVQRVLRSVPDDPGALLRRKFELEYLQRHGRTPDLERSP